MWRKGICLLLSMVMVLGLLCGCQSGPDLQENTIRAAVVYSGGDAWADTVYHLEQSPMLGLTVQPLKLDADAELSGFDVLYLDESLLTSAPEGFSDAVQDFTGRGGAVFLPNGFCDFFPKEFLGISEVRPLSGCGIEAEYPLCEGDAGALQTLVRDYAGLYAGFADYAFLSEQDYGWGVVPDTAQPLVVWEGLGVYTLNRYEAGYVFLTNPMLPAAWSTGSLTMEPGEGMSTFASTTASFDRLLLCGFAEFVAKQRYGFALERVNGYFGTPSMAWELHYEEITGIENGALQRFSQLCEAYDQIPSYTLIRNSYTWFLRTESVTYLLNRGAEGFAFEMDFDESAYSSGTHVDAGGQWLTLAQLESAGSYFADYPEYTIRAYPQAADLNGDGLTDLVSGSSDGRIHWFEGTGFSDGRLHTKAAVALTDPSGQELRLGGFSAPRTADLNGDGQLDLLCGWDDGTVRWFAGEGSMEFSPRGVLLDTGAAGQALPGVGDFNGDGIPDLAVGSDRGELKLWFGTRDPAGTVGYDPAGAVDLSSLCAESELGSWLAPAAVDWNLDGRTDLAVGVFQGYVALLLSREDGGFTFGGYITNPEMNYKGNHNLKFGNWAVPCFADLDGDRREDLLCGSQEYGNAYPIDSTYFPLRRELQEQVDYVLDHDYYMGVHFYTNAYASAQRELYELLAHKKALESYGLDTSRVGVNQHTWYTSSLSGSQTMASVFDAGLYWQSGFAAPGGLAGAPQVAAENVVSLPFFLMEDGEPTTLVQNNATLLYADNFGVELSARYRMPVCIFYHCDFAYLSDDASHQVLQNVQQFRERYGYNFNREDQLMLASAAALNQRVACTGSLEDRVMVRPEAPARTGGLHDEDVYSSLGVRVAFSDSVELQALQVDADVWYLDGRSLVLGLGREVSFSLTGGTTQPHIRRINMAARVTPTDTGAQVQFLSGGMMELAVEGTASTDSPGWKVIQRENETVFIKFGSNESLNLIF